MANTNKPNEVAVLIQDLYDIRRLMSLGCAALSQGGRVWGECMSVQETTLLTNGKEKSYKSHKVALATMIALADFGGHFTIVFPSQET